MTVPTPTTAPPEQAPAFTLNDLLIYMAKQQASDLHLKPMRPPLMRVRGKLVSVNTAPLKPPDLEKMLLPLLNRVQREKFDAVQSVDFGYGVAGAAGLRAPQPPPSGPRGGALSPPPRLIPIVRNLHPPPPGTDPPPNPPPLLA